MDSDCLVKLTKAGAKEMVASAIVVHIPPLVKKETVDEAIRLGHQDAVIIGENIKKKALHVVEPGMKRNPVLSSAKGEADVVSLYLDGGYDAIASDDQKFLKKLAMANIPYLTPAACLIFLYKDDKIGRPQALEMVESLKAFISQDEYAVARLYLEGKS